MTTNIKAVPESFIARSRPGVVTNERKAKCHSSTTELVNIH